MVQSIAYPLAGGASSCGYCSPPGERSKERSSIHVANLEAIRLSADVYQRMIDRGWRRSGQYCYKPDMRKTCCPQYTIKLDALAFKPGRNHRKLIHRWNRYILQGQGDPDAMSLDVKRAKGRDNAPFDLVPSIHSAEGAFLEGKPAKHKFEVTLEPASFTEEKFSLFCKYQANIHNEDDKSASGFKRFLVDTPLEDEQIPYTSAPASHLPLNYGSYHQLYRVDGKLIAAAVLDILPSCVSSVYFMYDTDWDQYSMGKLSALREVSLAYEMHQAGAPGMKYLYMGYYIYSCPKMRYKGEYSPSYLADPETYEWYPLEKCIPILQKNRYACFSDPSKSLSGDWKSVPPQTDPEVDVTTLGEVYVLQRRNGVLIAVPLPHTPHVKNKAIKRDFNAIVRGLGLELAQDIIWAV